MLFYFYINWYKGKRTKKIKNVDLLNIIITFNSTKNKKTRNVPISLSFLEAKQEYLNIRNGDGEDYLFCSIYNGKLLINSLQKAVKNYSNEGGIETRSQGFRVIIIIYLYVQQLIY